MILKVVPGISANNWTNHLLREETMSRYGIQIPVLFGCMVAIMMIMAPCTLETYGSIQATHGQTSLQLVLLHEVSMWPFGTRQVQLFGSMVGSKIVFWIKNCGSLIHKLARGQAGQAAKSSLRPAQIMSLCGMMPIEQSGFMLDTIVPQLTWR